ncbi:MAG TPA: HD domain-containing phosphohydrolase [Thermodesulfovibrionales bacterium]|nr:HD domain-containing phosphohydrolase [Thermodesulfovibrionales bacterium]
MESTEDKIASHGRSFLTSFYILLRMTGIYDSMNEAILNAARKLVSDMELLLDETGEATVRIIEGSFYIEGMRVKAGVSDIGNFESLAEELRNKSIGALDFRTPLRAEDLIRFAYAIKEGVDAVSVQSSLENELVKGISVGGPVAVQEAEAFDLKDSREMAKTAYRKALSAMVEVDHSLKAGLRIKLKRVKRALQLLVDCILADQSYLLRLTATAQQDRYYYFHPVNVSILSATLGREIGLGRIAMRTLALAAFFHDIGKTWIPAEILSKKTDFTKAEFELMKRHPVDGMKAMLKSFGLNEATILSMLVLWEHHVRLDHSGYPESALQRDPNLFSRIVSVADDYDSLVSGRVYERKRLSHDDALRMIYGGAGTLYDPLLARAFIEMFGVKGSP